MGLDWIARDKADGTTPYDTLGMKRLDKRDPQTVEAFKVIWQSNHNAATASDSHSNDHFTSFWSRPFEEVLDEEASKDEPPYIQGTGEDVPEFCSGGSFATPQAISFRGKCVARFCGLSDDLQDRCFGEDDGDGAMMSPEFAEDLARDLEIALQNGEYSADDGEEEWVKDTLLAASLYLRFWSGNGHPIYCWY